MFTSELRVEDKFSQESTLFAVGEPIVFMMRITNNDDSPAMLSYADGCPSSRFVVLDFQDRNVFDSLPEEAVCAALFRTVDFAPREAKEFELEWNQARSDQSSQVAAGRYTVNGRDRSIECAGELDRAGSFRIQ